jgi:integrase
MANTKNHRGWGHIRRLPSRRYQATYTGPDLARHNAPGTFGARMDAEHWLADERRAIDRDEWTPPKLRTAQRRAQSKTLGEFATEWIEHRNLKPRSKSGYESLLKLHISDSIGKVPLRHLNAETVRVWYAKLDRDYVRRNSHAYGLLHAICATAVKDNLLQQNPCQIERAMNPARKRDPVILTVPEVARLADAIKPECYKAFVLLAAWCGLRWGEVIELRRADIGAGCEIITVARAVTRNAGAMRVSTPKSGKGRTVVVPPHIRADLKHHLDTFTARKPDALLFPNSTGAHLNDTVFRRGHFRPALKTIGRDGVRVHDLRHFAGTQTARVGNLVETMGRLGHSTAKASLGYQAVVSGRDAEIAAALSVLASGAATGPGQAPA